jgi:hypothetical protein
MSLETNSEQQTQDTRLNTETPDITTEFPETEEKEDVLLGMDPDLQEQIANADKIAAENNKGKRNAQKIEEDVEEEVKTTQEPIKKEGGGGQMSILFLTLLGVFIYGIYYFITNLKQWRSTASYVTNFNEIRCKFPYMLFAGSWYGRGVISPADNFMYCMKQIQKESFSFQMKGFEQTFKNIGSTLKTHTQSINNFRSYLQTMRKNLIRVLVDIQKEIYNSSKRIINFKNNLLRVFNSIIDFFDQILTAATGAVYSLISLWNAPVPGGMLRFVCFDPDTKVLYADGASHKSIAHVQLNDAIYPTDPSVPNHVIGKIKLKSEGATMMKCSMFTISSSHLLYDPFEHTWKRTSQHPFTTHTLSTYLKPFIYCLITEQGMFRISSRQSPQGTPISSQDSTVSFQSEKSKKTTYVLDVADFMETSEHGMYMAIQSYLLGTKNKKIDPQLCSFEHYLPNFQSYVQDHTILQTYLTMCNRPLHGFPTNPVANTMLSDSYLFYKHWMDLPECYATMELLYSGYMVTFQDGFMCTVFTPLWDEEKQIYRFAYEMPNTKQITLVHQMKIVSFLYDNNETEVVQTNTQKRKTLDFIIDQNSIANEQIDTYITNHMKHPPSHHSYEFESEIFHDLDEQNIFLEPSPTHKEQQLSTKDSYLLYDEQQLLSS